MSAGGAAFGLAGVGINQPDHRGSYGKIILQLAPDKGYGVAVGDDLYGQVGGYLEESVISPFGQTGFGKKNGAVLDKSNLDTAI